MFITACRGSSSSSKLQDFVVKWAPFLRFGVPFVHANLCRHLSRSLSLSAILDSSRRCRSFAKIVLFPQFDTVLKYLSIL